MNIVDTKKLIPLKFDLMFKKVFGDNSDTESLKYLLKCILDIDAVEITILNSEILSDSYYNKDTTVDLIVKVKDGTLINIEVNTNVNNEIINRNLFYMFRIISNNLRKKEKYINLNKHIQINFDFAGKHIKPITKYKLIEVDTKEILTDKLEIIRIDVPYFTKKCYTISAKELSTKDKIIGFIGIEDEYKAKDISSGNEYMEVILKKMEGFSKEEIMAAMYDRKEYEKFVFESEIRACRKEGYESGYQKGIKKGIKDGIQKGIEQGIEQSIIKTAKNMLKENIDKQIISKITNLTLEQINGLR